MVKIRELTHSQLRSQIVKYTDILTKLTDERERRTDQGAPNEELYTPEEIKVRNPLPIASPSEPGFDEEERQEAEEIESGLSLGDETIASINLLNLPDRSEEVSEEEEVAITQLLNLNKIKADKRQAQKNSKKKK